MQLTVCRVERVSDCILGNKKMPKPRPDYTNNVDLQIVVEHSANHPKQY